MKRDLQLSLIEGNERPVGPIPQSVFVGTNAELLRAVAGLYLTGATLDVTYGGRGYWWDCYRPEVFAWHDLALDGVDCRALPEADGAFDTVCFDPPYVESGTPGNSHARPGTPHAFFKRFGIGSRRISGVLELLADGTAEACRVARCFVLVKCMEYVAGSRFNDAPTVATLAALEAGWHKHDVIVHLGAGMGGAHRIRDVLRAERAHSYLLVFTPRRHPRRAR